MTYIYTKKNLMKKAKIGKKDESIELTINFSGHHINQKLNKQETIKVEKVEFSKKFKDIPDYILSEIYHELKKLLS